MTAPLLAASIGQGGAAVLGALFGGAVTIVGGYLAERAQDRRLRRASTLSDLGPEFVLLARVARSDPAAVGGDDYKAADTARRSALATSSRDSRHAQRILNAAVALRAAVERSQPTWSKDRFDLPYYEGQLPNEVDEFVAAIDAYLTFLVRSLDRGFARRFKKALRHDEVALPQPLARSLVPDPKSLDPSEMASELERRIAVRSDIIDNHEERQAQAITAAQLGSMFGIEEDELDFGTRTPSDQAYWTGVVLIAGVPFDFDATWDDVSVRSASGIEVSDVNVLASILRSSGPSERG